MGTENNNHFDRKRVVWLGDVLYGYVQMLPLTKVAVSCQNIGVIKFSMAREFH